MNTESLDDTLSLLSHHHRRWTIQYLRAVAGNSVSIEVLSEHLESKAASDSRAASVEPDDVQVELHHNHLPKLADHDLIEYDADSGTVSYTPTVPVETILDGVSNDLGAVSN